MILFRSTPCLCALALAALIATAPARASEPYDFGNPTPDEEWMRFLINRARINPEAEADALGVVNNHPDAKPRGDYDVGEGITLPVLEDQRDYWSRYQGPRQPVAWNRPLSTAARNHSQDLYTYNYFEHFTEQSDFGYPWGAAPWDRAVAEGYTTHYIGENLTVGTPAGAYTAEDMHVGLFTEPDFPGRGHRRNMLASAWREVGVGYYTSTPNAGGWTDYWTIDFGSDAFRADPSDPYPAPDTVFVTGTAYDDADGNGEYQPGEELPGLRVYAWASGGLLKHHALTAAGGGYTIPLIRRDGSDVLAEELVRVIFFDPANGRYLPLPERALMAGEVIMEDDPEISPDTFYQRLNLRADALAADFEQLLPGDANFDGHVGIADLVALADHYGVPHPSWLDGDFNFDGHVGIADLSLLADNYGEGGEAPVPEPTAVLLLAPGALAIRRRR